MAQGTQSQILSAWPGPLGVVSWLLFRDPQNAMQKNLVSCSWNMWRKIVEHDMNQVYVNVSLKLMVIYIYKFNGML